MPELAGVSHVALSVRDREASARWYAAVLGFAELERLADERNGFREVVLVHAGSGMVVCLQQHDGNGGEAFDPRRTGLDHVAFKVARRADLDVWASHLTGLRVTYSPVVDAAYGSVLCLRDPDQIQVELFFRPDH